MPDVDRHRVVAYTQGPAEWVVEVDGIRRARFVGPDAAFAAARCANEWRKILRNETSTKEY